MQKVWNILWKQFECATNEFNAYIDGGIPAIAPVLAYLEKMI